ncbi:hypothetical protein PsorP6_011458 [Peronosclerospora sorghi]|uniref:Uncharacterized protein n=1 Tax=Peronosclerospora sorghi TaxID=230839 RepID=A0ACC0WKN8_9STRA|nr:hypothetical protein PsorP6_011458 [Peronosclerospora sorghi]
MKISITNTVLKRRANLAESWKRVGMSRESSETMEQRLGDRDAIYKVACTLSRTDEVDGNCYFLASCSRKSQMKVIVSDADTCKHAFEGKYGSMSTSPSDVGSKLGSVWMLLSSSPIRCGLTSIHTFSIFSIFNADDRNNVAWFSCTLRRDGGNFHPVQETVMEVTKNEASEIEHTNRHEQTQNTGHGARSGR